MVAADGGGVGSEVGIRGDVGPLECLGERPLVFPKMAGEDGVGFPIPTVTTEGPSMFVLCCWFSAPCLLPRLALKSKLGDVRYQPRASHKGGE